MNRKSNWYPELKPPQRSPRVATSAEQRNARTAQAIYAEVYASESETHRAHKLHEIELWLADFSPSDDLAELIAEWREYDAA